MFFWAGVFFAIALVAAVFGFGGIVGVSVGVAKLLFFVFMTLCVVTLVARLWNELTE